MNDITTTDVQQHPLANPQKALDAMLQTGALLRKHTVVNAQGDDGNSRPITRDVWFRAVGNVINSGVLNKQQIAKLKHLRDELRRTKVKA